MAMTLRPYAEGDWKAVLDLCLRAFAPGYDSLERSLGADLDWQACIRTYLRALTRRGERQRLIVAEAEGAVVGVVHYHVDAKERSGSIGVSAVHPAHQGRGVASRMYVHVLDVMRAQGLKYATAETEGDSAKDPVRRAYEKAGFVALPVVRYFIDFDARGIVPERRALVVGRADDVGRSTDSCRSRRPRLASRRATSRPSLTP